MKYTKEDQKRINLIALLEDYQHALMIELKPRMRHGMKKMLNNCILHTGKFIRECDSIILETEDFGETSDQIRELIEKNITWSNSEND